MASSSRKSGRKSPNKTLSQRPYLPTIAVPPILYKPVAEMSKQELLELLHLLHAWMADDKQPREVDYLRGREARQRAQYGQPMPTRTDRDYQRDQPYETRLIDLLETMICNAETADNRSGAE